MFHDVDDGAEVADIREWPMKSKTILRTDKAHQAAREVCQVVQIETVSGLEAVDDITSGGLEVVEIGRSDLTTGLGHPGQRNHPLVNATIDRIVAAFSRNNVAPAVTCFPMRTRRISRGVRNIPYSAGRYILEKAHRYAMQSFARL